MFRRSSALAVATFSFALAAAAPAPAQISYETIAFQGDPLPGVGPGIVLADFSSPRFQNTGQITFYGFLSGPGIDTSNYYGVFVVGPDGPRLAIRHGDPAPGIDGAYIEYPHYAIVAPGQELFHSLLSGPGVDSHTAQAAWLRTPTATTLIYRMGDPAPETEPGTKHYGLLDLIADRNGHVLYEDSLTGPAVTPDRAQAIYAGPIAAPQLLARTGDPAPDTGGQVFSQLVAPTLGAGGHVAFVGNVASTGNDYNRLFYGTTDAVHMAIGPGAHAPGTEDGVSFRWLWLHRVNALGQVLLPTDEALTGPGVDNHNNDGIWAGTPDNLKLVARSGDIAPGTGGKRYNGIYDMTADDEAPMFIDAVIGDGGHVAFSARLTDGDGNLLPEWGFWAGLPGDLKLIEHHVIRQPRINAAGQLVYNDDLDGDPGTLDGAMILADLQGHRQAIIYRGQTFDFGNGDVRTVLGWDSETNDIAALSDSGQFLINAVFTDGSRAMILATIPEPGALPLAAMAAILLRRRRVSHLNWR